MLVYYKVGRIYLCYRSFNDYVNEYFDLIVNYFDSFPGICSKKNCNRRQKNNHPCVARVTKVVLDKRNVERSEWIRVLVSIIFYL
jgi:hypothetical protein